MKNLLKIVSLFLVSSGFAHAATIAGTYQNRADCAFGNDSFLGQKHIPAGKVVVTENIPYSSDFTDEATPSILVQSNGVAQPVLALRIGRHQPFAYGSSAYSMGTYAQAELFQEAYFESHDAAAAGTIQLQATDSSLMLTVSSPSFTAPVSCTFSR